MGRKAIVCLTGFGHRAARSSVCGILKQSISECLLQFLDSRACGLSFRPCFRLRFHLELQRIDRRGAAPIRAAEEDVGDTDREPALCELPEGANPVYPPSETIDGRELAHADGDRPQGRGQDPVARLALIVTPSNMENDLRYGSGAEARL